MRSLRTLAMVGCVSALMAALVAAKAAGANEFQVNGWYPCSTSDNDEIKPTFECAEVIVPLCYEGLCTSDKDIHVFVKRKLANTTAEDGIKQAIWLLQGGPGDSSIAMEGHMNMYYEKSGGSLSVYTMDHRGTGRSHPLVCEAAQAFTARSPSGYNLNITEYSTCFKDLLFQMDDQPAAFSVTSAAKDLEYLIQNLNADEETFVYGVSYGTFLTLREMHLAPKQVKGYLLDGIISEAGPDEDTRMTYSYWEYDVIPTTERFFEYCRNDSACPLEFTPDGKAIDQVRANLSSWDNQCMNEIVTQYGSFIPDEENPAVFALRLFFSQTSKNMKDRELIPGILARAFDCDDQAKDEMMQVLKAVLQKFLQPDDPVGDKPDFVDGSNTLLYNLIVFSEQWSVPSPTQDILDKYLELALFSVHSNTDLQLYCTFTRNQDEDACQAVTIPDGPRFAYEVDQYFNKTAVIPDGSSVLMFNGKLDYQTASEYGTYQYHQMQGGDKMLIEFDYGGHGSGLGQLPGENFECGYDIGVSFVKNHGDTDKVDTSCMNNLSPMDFSDAAFVKLLAQLTEENNASSGVQAPIEGKPMKQHKKDKIHGHTSKNHQPKHKHKHHRTHKHHKHQESPEMKKLRQRLQTQALLSRFGF